MPRNNDVVLAPAATKHMRGNKAFCNGLKRGNIPYCHNMVCCNTYQLQRMITLQLALLLQQDAKPLQRPFATHFFATAANEVILWQLVPVATILALLPRFSAVALGGFSSSDGVGSWSG